MVNVSEILLILFAHFVADFICQTDEMAINKSKSNVSLTAHVLAYSLAMIVILFWFYPGLPIINWLIFNGALHWVTDYFTSRLNAYIWKKEMRHWFFVGIGADQMIHFTCLLLTYKWFL